ncbi:MAG: hypothetical protein FJW56_05880 [Actinobacteria bacterium]|nr:hypothetical protein [Actinomycetota bacterium]
MNEQKILKTSKKIEFYVTGMHCPACELVIEKKLGELKCVNKVDAVLYRSKVYLTIDSDTSSEEFLKNANEIIKPHGYEISGIRSKHKVNYKDLGIGFLIAAAITAIFFLIQKLGIANILGGRSFSIAMAFLIGIVASLSSCMAIVGGLVLSISSSYAKGKDRVWPLVLFHISRIAGFFLLGGLIGLLGTAFNLSRQFYFIMSIILFAVMIILGINLLDVLPFFKKFTFRMPKNMSRKITARESIQNRFMPLLLGVLTFFLPCGFTQSMQINAISSGDFIKGGMIMLVFALGTLPVLALISFSSFKFSQSPKAGIFFKTSGFIVIFFAIFNFINALVAAGVMMPVF